MRKQKVLGTVVTVLVIFLVGCDGCKKKNEKVYPANIIVLLDLSDRVSVEKYGELARKQVNDDKDNCITIIKAFDDILRKETYSNSKSQLRFFVPDQKGFPIDSESKKSLRVFGESPIGNASKFDDLEIGITNTIDRLYTKVLTTPEENFTGVDIWGWFKDKAQRYLKPEFRNYIICLSDGYLDFDGDIQDNRDNGTFIIINDELRKSDDWEEKVRGEYKLLRPPEVDFSQYPATVKFLMFGIKDRTSKGSLRDREILKAYWEPWLESMGIESIGFYSSDVEKEEITTFLDASQ